MWDFDPIPSESRNWPDEQFTRTSSKYKELKNIFQDGHGVMNFVFFVVEVSHPGSSDYRVCHGSVRTHSPVARICFCT